MVRCLHISADITFFKKSLSMELEIVFLYFMYKCTTMKRHPFHAKCDMKVPFDYPSVNRTENCSKPFMP